MEKNIAVIWGDCSSPEIVKQTLRVLDKVAEKYGHTFHYTDAAMGGEAIDKYGDPLPQHELDKCLAADSVLLGAVGGPKWEGLPGEQRPEKGLLRLRAGMGLYSNNRPAKIWPQLAPASPLKPEIVAQGIDSARVKVTMLSDGTATYNNFHNYFGDAATAEQNWNDYAAEVEALDWNHGGRYPETRAPEEFASYTWPYYLSTRPDYRLMLQNSSLMESSCPFIADRLAAMKMESVQPYELLTALPEASKQQFYRMAKFDYARFAGLFDLSPKKNLIIIGTSHSSAASEQQQAAYVERIIQQYGSDYDIFFKPHPADSSSAGYPDRFEGLTLLPGQMPFEIFVWALLDKIDMIGGYPSTTFISVPLDKVGFLFAADADGLVRPLNILFRDAANVEWIQ